MVEPDVGSVRDLERSGFGEMLRDFLTHKHLIRTDQASGEDAVEETEGSGEEPGSTDEAVSERAAAVARLVIEAKNQAAPPGAA